MSNSDPFGRLPAISQPKVDRTIQKRYCPHILFVGRIAPNKCQEDLLRAFCCYQKCYHTQSRLVLVGSWTGMERYYKRLRMYAEELEIAQDVLLRGIQISMMCWRGIRSQMCFCVRASMRDLVSRWWKLCTLNFPL